MFDALIREIVKLLLRLRYRVRIKGLEKIKQQGTEKILFLPNHPAYIDPLILYAWLHSEFRPFGYGLEKYLEKPVIRYLTRRMGVRALPDISEEGTAARETIQQKLAAGVEDLKGGSNLIIWPAGRVRRNSSETIGANSAVETLVKGCPEARVVLIRTSGLWGSVFSWGAGRPEFSRMWRLGIKTLLKNFIFFTPRREVTIELEEPADFPKQADRFTLNRYLEDFYNQSPESNLYVPYTVWEKLAGAQPRPRPEPESRLKNVDASQVPSSIREAVTAYLKETAGVSDLDDEQDLGADLGLDSLTKTDIVLWLEKEFGFSQSGVSALKTVGDVMLAAAGQLFVEEEKPLQEPSKKWFAKTSSEPLRPLPADSINQAFLLQAALSPGAVAAADQISGEKTYRQIITSCMALQPVLREQENERVGIMMPASAGAAIVYLAVLFAGKTPVMVNWTLGSGPVAQCLESVNAGKVITSKKFYSRVKEQGFDFSAFEDRLCFLEDMAGRITLFNKLRALFGAWFNWSALRDVQPTQDAVILFTSGSETVPKAVPLTHQNILANLADVTSVVDIEKRERIMGFLPPFHSFGLTCTILVPLLCGSPAVYHPNPMETGVIIRIIAAYKVNIVMGTPTFLRGIVKTGSQEQLRSMRLAVTGAEKCPDEVYRTAREKCPDTTILEGYGVTECSPIIALNDLHKPVQGSIGRVLPSLEYRLLDPESREPVSVPGRGILVVRGPSVFRGYLNNPGKEPFVEVEGKKWYDTGDLVYEDENSVLFFQARLKRFVKIGGEMISLPAIEATLNNAFAGEEDEGPLLAVEAGETDAGPEIILFTVRDEITREKANNALRQAGMSGLQHIRRVKKVEEIPLLGTGKIDYRTLKKSIDL